MRHAKAGPGFAKFSEGRDLAGPGMPYLGAPDLMIPGIQATRFSLLQIRSRPARQIH